MSQQVKIDSGAVFNNITISNSKLTHGVAGIQMFGRNVGSRSQNNSAINNKIDSAILYGISTNFVNVGELSKNVIIMSDTANVASEGIRILFSKFNTILSQNYTKNVGSRGLNLTSVEGISGLTIANNMFAGGYKTTGLGAGIYLNEVNKVNLTHNSVYYDGVSTTQPDFSSAFFVAAGSNISLYNNIFYNPTGGYAYFVTNVTSIREANNNIYYTDNNPSSGLFAYLGSDKLNLTALRATVPGIETSSLEINPQFVSNLDLHTTNVNLEGKGLYLSSINKDYDGQDRNPLGTDIGADEFIIHNKDLAVLDIQPIVFSTDPNSISVKLMNLGSTSLNGSTIKLQYSSNGTTWLPAAGESYTIGAGGNASLATPYSTASFTFSTPFNATANNTYPFYIRILPSDRIIGDPVTKNDTVNLTICTGLKAGVYTIGGTNPTYPDFNSAVNAIACGVTGPVVFNVRPGTYDERFTIGNPKNTSAVNSITFKAENNDSSSVIIKNVGVSSNTTRNVIRLNRSSFINLKHLTIQNASNSIVGSAGIQITSESRNINITNCRIELDTLTTSPNIFGITTSDSANLTVFGKGGSNIRISKNHIIGGNLGVSIKGSNQYIRETGIIIDSNILEYVAQTAISTSNTDASSISNNKIIMRKNQSSSTGLSVTINRGDTKITNNVIYNAATTGVTFNDVLPINWVLFANNMIGGNFRLNTEGVGVTLNKVTAMKIYNNSILYDGNSVFGTGLKVDNDSRNIRLINNTIANTSTGFCFTYINQLSIDTSDNNNFFTKGVLFARVEGTDYLNFDEYRDARLTDEKSVSVDPDYFTNTNLHITNTFLDGGALPLKEVTHDIDGELRNVEFPDIGADEFLVRGDVEIVSIDSPLPSPEVYPSKVPVTITVRNKGLSKISGLNVKYYVDNIEIANEVIPVDEPYKPMLPTDLQTYEFLTPFEPTASGIYNMRVEAYLPDDIDLTNNEKNISFRSSVSSIVDGEVSAFVSPANSSVNQLTNVRVLIKNAGTVAIKDFNVNYTLRGGLSGVINRTEYFGTDSILPLQTGSFIFTDLIDCDNQFDRFLSVYISDLGNDINQQNDTLVMYIKPHAPCFSAVELDPNQFMLTAPWPNPTASELNYDINVLQPTSLNIEIIDVLGHIIKTVNYHQINKGVNHLNMDVSNLAPGVYYSRVSIDGKFYTDRVVITR